MCAAFVRKDVMSLLLRESSLEIHWPPHTIKSRGNQMKSLTSFRVGTIHPHNGN